MARTFAVETEILPVVPDLDRPAGMSEPLDRSGHCHRHFRRGIVQRGFERVLAEQVKQVGDQQLLVLFLVMAAQLDQRTRCRRQPRQHLGHRRVDVGAIGADLVERRPRYHPAAVAGMAPPLRLVIAVEQERPARVMERIARHVVAQHEGLEEPGGVREMPFGGAGVGHRLDGRVGFRQARRQCQTERAGPVIVPKERIRGGRGSNRHRPSPSPGRRPLAARGKTRTTDQRGPPGTHRTSPPPVRFIQRASTNK